MKYTFLKYLALGGLAISFPMLLAASTHTSTRVDAFRGPAKAPPSGNVAGVIWNLPPGSTPQDAEINITGQAKLKNISTAVGSRNELFGDIFLEAGKQIRIDTSGASTFGIGNWGGLGGTQMPLTLTVNGGLKIDSIAPAGLGNDGRVQADKFCFNPGAAADCISAWSGPGGPGGGGGGGGGGTLTGITAGSGISVSGAAPSPTVSLDGTYTDGRYVKKTGDTMSGPLFINSSQAALDVRGGADGTSPAARIFATHKNVNGLEILMPPMSTKVGIVIGTIHGLRPTKGITAYATKTGGEFWGTDYGIDAKSFASTDSVISTAVRGSNGKIGGDFSGSTSGIVANGGTAGSSFTNDLGQTTYIAYPGYGILSTVGPTNIGLFTDGLIYTSGDITAIGSISTNNILATGHITSVSATTTNLGVLGNINASGNLNAPNNIPESCTWLRLSADGDSICPLNKFMIGVRTTAGTVSEIRCCNL